MYWTRKHVIVCTASHCISKGANDVVGRLRLEIVRRKLDAQILVNNCGTIDLCDIGPNVIIYPDNVIYSGVTVKDLPEIIESLLSDTVVDRLRTAANTPAESSRKACYAHLVQMGAQMEREQLEAAAAEHGFDEGWLKEQQRRGFLARKVDQETEAETWQVTKKSRDRYGL